MAGALREVIDFQRHMARLAGAIADGDLTQRVEPKSERDAFAHAFGRMIDHLRALVGEVRSTAMDLAANSSAARTGSAQMRRGRRRRRAGDQRGRRRASASSRSAEDTDGAVMQLVESIDGIASGTSEQAHQVQVADSVARRW